MTTLILRPVRDDEEDAEVVREVAAAAFGARLSLPYERPAGGDSADGWSGSAFTSSATSTATGGAAGGDGAEGWATNGGRAGTTNGGRAEDSATNSGRAGSRATSGGRANGWSAHGDRPFDEWAPGGWSVERIARHRSRTRHLARTDPGGCWLVEDQVTGPVGVVLSSRREGTWALSLLAVVPGAQGKGVGKALLARALEYGRACLRRVVCAPADPVAVRTFRRAGFDLHPAMRLTGLADPARLAPLDGAVHGGTRRHRDLMDSVDRRTRGGAHGPDHDELLRHHRLLVVDDLAGSGYCYALGGRVELLAATSRRLATRLLTAALLAAPPDEPVHVGHVLAEAQWAVDVGIAAGLDIGNDGFVCLRGMRPAELALPSALLP